MFNGHKIYFDKTMWDDIMEMKMKLEVCARGVTILTLC